ncbi:TPA: hypothetical protein ACK0CK_002641 [Staphylococcus aureus]
MDYNNYFERFVVWAENVLNGTYFKSNLSTLFTSENLNGLIWTSLFCGIAFAVIKLFSSKGDNGIIGNFIKGFIATSLTHIVIQVFTGYPLSNLVKYVLMSL